MRPLVFVLLLAVSPVLLWAQAVPKKDVKFGKVELSEFEIKPGGADSAAGAVKLFDIGSCRFDPSTNGMAYVFERHFRYKILNKNAYDLANLEIQLYTSSQGGKEDLEVIQGSAYNLENGKIVESKINKDAKFSEKVDRNYTIKKVTVPNVKENTIIEFRLRIKSDFIFQLRSWYFQGNYPTLWSDYTVIIPDWFRYKTNLNGYQPVELVENATITQNYVFKNAHSQNDAVAADANLRRYVAKDIPAFKDEPFITTKDDHISKLSFELNSTNTPGGGYRDYTATWPKIVQGLYEDENFGLYLGKVNYTKPLLAGILKGETDPEKKMLLVYTYVKSAVKWDEEYSIYSSQLNAKAVLEKKSGNSADINLTLINLLKEAGISAKPVLVSTRGNGTHPGTPLLTQFNSVIARALINDRYVLLDAIDKNLPAGMISRANLNHKGLEITPTTYEAQWVDLESTVMTRTNFSYTLKLDAGNTLAGNVYTGRTVYDALNQRDEYQSATNKDEYIKSLRATRNGLEISNFTNENLDDPNATYTEQMVVKITDQVEEAGNLVYFTPLLYERTKENPFKLVERKFPVDFAHPFEENYRLILEFPANYQLDKLPKSEAFKLPDNKAAFSFLFSADGNKIAVQSKISISKSVFTSEEYFDLKELFNKIVAKQAEQVVFRKN